MSEYIRDQWGVEEGFPGGPVYAIAQTPDGYLWIGTEKGLVRFDGLRFSLFQRSTLPTSPVGPVLGLTVDSEGNLWVRQGGPTLLRYHDGAFRDVIAELPETEANVTAMCLEKSGGVLFSGLANGAFEYKGGRFLTLASRDQQSRLVISLAESPDGKIWVGTRESGLFFIQEGQVHALSKKLQDRKINSLLPINSRELWIGTDDGLVRWDGTELSPVAARALDHIQVLAMIGDRDSNFWVGTSTGLLRVNAKGVSSLGGGDRHSAEEVTALFEDREGNLWIGTARGIERFREAVFTTYSMNRGLPSDNIGPVFIDSQGHTWFAPLQGGLYWLKDGEIRSEKGANLDRDVVYSIAGGKDGLWLGRQKGGLTHLQYTGSSFTSETYTEAQGLAQNSVYAVHQSRDGTVWAGTLRAGLTSFKNGRFKTYTKADGLASNTIASIAEGIDGTMWFGTPNGVNALSNGKWRVYTSSDGLPPGTANCLLQDSKGILWVGTANGLAFIRSGSVLTPHESSPEALREEILGIEEDGFGWLWIATANHVLRVNRDKLLSLALGQEDVRDYSLADGLRGMEGVKRHQSVVSDLLGRIWFSTNGGLSFVDPSRTTGSSVPAAVHVEGITADGRKIKLGNPIRIAAPHQRITVAYAGLSLSVPERVRFKYKLDGFDRDWSEPVTNREAAYTNLGAGSYLFRVVATNSDGQWNSSESVVRFEIEPVFWRTWWFLLAAALALALLLLALIRLRLLQLTRQLQMRFDERLAERTRIARELHDTLLQGFLSASMQLDVANDRMPPDSPAKPLVNRVLELMRHVIEEGRNELRGLRSSKRSSPDLEQAFSQIRHEFPAHTEIAFRVIVEGAPRPLGPVIRDDVYFIGHEALSNAFRHSRSTEVEVEIEYAASKLRVLVRDNGCGIDPHVLDTGREGHWGLSGMRERAGRIGSKLRVLSRATAGTEVELTVPAKIAYALDQRERPAG